MRISEKLESARKLIQIDPENKDWIDYADAAEGEYEVYDNTTIDEIVEDFKLYLENI